ncbi:MULTISPECIES: catalase KatA [unclassified Peribacillus]|uniref:catalase KatA n=1 Tax=unclassified Peribacillus TaxID=2675266 RepID=UPI0019140902|nr:MULTISPECIES: catalase KatA [unclassified Peribacillus]MBK5443725.1 catalase [Peribacillus sp. TH24]MBK5461554.1 catalase [Peribacillus sp. TH27]WMX55221.1 catalase KatA [Peribacillus sp. R9-11]
MTNKKNLTTSWGAPVGDNQNSITAGQRGPVLIQDVHLLEKLAHFNRERVPERVVHAKGAGAFGTFEVTNDLSKYTKAKLFNGVGKKTDLFIRFSTVAGELGSADTVRDPRGFAVKFYTEEGNYDIVGNNTPVFFIRDAIKFPDFIHTQKRDPRTHLKNPTAVWDFWSHSPESLHQVTILMSDRGIPATLRHTHGFGSHTFKWVNDEGQGVWVKYHFKTEQGIKNLDVNLAAKLAGENPDYHTEDLFNAIEKGDFPAWKLYVQIMPLEDADTYRFDPFDVTKVWSQKDYPLIELGRMELNRNPENYFAEVEQATFSPGTFVPGIEASPDKMLQGRLFAYGDAHRYRVGSNHNQLPVNRPKVEASNYQRDGFMRADDNGKGSVYYEPNSFDGPAETAENKTTPFEVTGQVAQVGHNSDDHYTQAGDLYRLLSEEEKTRLVETIVGAMKPVELEEIKLRQIGHFYKADPEYGTRIAEGLGLVVPEEARSIK